MPTKSDFDVKLNALLTDHVRNLVSEIAKVVRQNLAARLGAIISGTEPAAVAPKRKAVGRAARKRVVACLSPGCGNPSKGPRFHYLCEKHKDAPTKDYEAWRKAKQTKA